MNDPLRRLTVLLSRLPGIGEKTALRLALAIVNADDGYAVELSRAVAEVDAQLRLCSRCNDLTHLEVCERCSDATRDPTTICVVAHPQDRMALDRSGVFRGHYHVLHGVLDPLGGVGPAELKLQNLVERLRDGSVKEVIVATSPNVEGDATALYISRLLSPLSVKVTRIASGVAVGGELEYADMTTLHRALQDRRVLE